MNTGHEDRGEDEAGPATGRGSIATWIHCMVRMTADHEYHGFGGYWPTPTRSPTFPPPSLLLASLALSSSHRIAPCPSSFHRQSRLSRCSPSIASIASCPCPCLLALRRRARPRFLLLLSRTSSLVLISCIILVPYWFITIMSKDSDSYGIPSRSSSLPFIFVSVSYL